MAKETKKKVKFKYESKSISPSNKVVIVIKPVINEKIRMKVLKDEKFFSSWCSL